MSDCRRTADLLAAYVDEALAPAERAEVDRHLGECGPCRNLAALEEGARVILKARAETLRAVALPPGLRSRCEMMARERTAAAALPFWRRLLVPLSVTALAMLVVAVAVFWLGTRPSNTVLAGQLTAELIPCVKAAGGPETASADATRLQSLLAELYGWNVRVPPSSAARGVELIGLRRCLYGSDLIPQVMYRTGGQNVSLYMLEGVTRGGEADVVTLGHRSRVWSRGATTFVLVSPEAAGDLTTAVEYLKQEAY